MIIDYKALYKFSYSFHMKFLFEKIRILNNNPNNIFNLAQRIKLFFNFFGQETFLNTKHKNKNHLWIMY